METNLASGRLGGAIARGDETIENLGSMAGNRASCEWLLRGSWFLHWESDGESRFFHDLVGSVAVGF